jgi:hypothetical protein
MGANDMSHAQCSPVAREGVHATDRTWGFRFSALDALVLLLVGGLLAVVQPASDSPVWAVAVVLGHFFLFCNVFRIQRSKELLWAAIFVVNVAFGLTEGKKTIDWPGVLLIQTPVTLGVILWEMRGPWYHGVFAKRINARLERFLKGEI